jgi:hypothetical protein
MLMAGATLWGQQQPQGRQEHQEEEREEQRQQEPQQPPPQGQQRRPTLGAPTEPSLSGPRTSPTSDPRKLLRIQKIFVEPMDNLLSEKLLSGLSKMGRFHIVTKREDSDAVMSGTCFDSRRLKSVHSEVYINDRGSGASIWQDIVRRPYNPPPLAKAIDDTAARILAHLSDSIQEAQHK